MKERVFWFGIILAIMSWIGNVLYLETKEIDEPIFMNHYYETYMQQDNHYLEFFYLTNKSEPLEVSHVQIDGIDAYVYPDQRFTTWNDQEVTFKQEFRYYYLKSVLIDLPDDLLPIDKESNQSWSFQNMGVYFSNGEQINAPIGEVVVHSSFPNDVRVMENRAGGSSSQHRAYNTAVMTEPVTIESITVPFSDAIGEDIAMKMDLDQEKLKELEKLQQDGSLPDWFKEDMDKEFDALPGVLVEERIFPISLDQGEWTKLNIQFNPTRDTYFQFDINLNGRTENGESFSFPVPIIDSPDLTEQQVKDFIKQRQGGSL
ncbi:hypothetical protein HNQ94_003230 [Salirhabdus euzebyi]|uniref:Uncharacterized protein n=1 Tax=Salirhabdus euzebyi TaxID=394506 RepID=A0A841Q8F2_9BACI|nr:hypothetical protein [Salirhabdus euzebyi]MBB6454741.1 hypothetical protein [Salirhabdus euzebyi]